MAGVRSASHYAGDTSGGLAIGMRNFWQLAPTALEIQNAAQDAAQMTLWLWSPDVPAMDLRPYDDKFHAGEATYEDWEPGYGDATGVARTSELTLRAYGDTPSDEELMGAARLAADPALLVCDARLLSFAPERSESGVFRTAPRPRRPAWKRNSIKRSASIKARSSSADGTVSGITAT